MTPVQKGGPLFQPLHVRGLMLRNRIAGSPMTQDSGENGSPVPWLPCISAT